MIEPHWHWTFLAFDGDAAAQNIPWVVKVSVTGRYTEEDARVMASSVIARDHYKLHSVYQCTTCGYQEAAAKSMQTLADNL